MKKLFKIGEYAIGGIIEADVKKDSIAIKARDWNTKSIIRQQTFYFNHNEMNLNSMLDVYLNDLTSSYYAEKIKEWIKKNL